MLPSFATWFTGFKTVFVFALRPFLPMWKFKWFPKCLNGGFRGVICIGICKSGLRILIGAPQVPFSVPPKTPKMGAFGYILQSKNKNKFETSEPSGKTWEYAK